MWRAYKYIFYRIYSSQKKLLIGNRCNCRKFQGESIGDAWAQPDFPNRKGNKRSKKNKIKTNVVTVETNAKRPEIGRLNINLMPMGIVKQDLVFSTSLLETTLMPIIPKPIKVEPNIVINNKKVILGQEYDMTIHFQLSRFLIETTTSNDKILNDLLKTLKDYPQLKILIKGNFMDDSRRTGDDIVNSLEGTMPIKEFQVKRAMAILKFLQANGVDSSRIKVDAGKIGSSASTTIIFTD